MKYDHTWIYTLTHTHTHTHTHTQCLEEGKCWVDHTSHMCKMDGFGVSPHEHTYPHSTSPSLYKYVCACACVCVCECVCVLVSVCVCACECVCVCECVSTYSYAMGNHCVLAASTVIRQQQNWCQVDGSNSDHTINYFSADSRDN